MTDKGFSKEIKDVLTIANTLLRESDTEETRIYVQQKLKEIREYLQEKQAKGEEILEKETEKENESIKILEDRINGLLGGSIRETDFLDYKQLYHELKETEWMEAFHALLENESLKVKTILQYLIEMLKITYDKCKTYKASQNRELIIEARWAGDKQNKQKDLQGLTDEQVQELKKHVNYCQDKTAPFCLQAISQKLLGEIKLDPAMMNRYRKQSERAVTAFDNYIIKCIEFSWIAHFEMPPINLITDPKRECPLIMDQFMDRKLVPRGKLVEWPALVQGHSLKSPDCLVKVPWLLYEKQLPRPAVLPAPKDPTPPPPKEIARMEIVATASDEDDNPSDEDVYIKDNIAISMPRADIGENINGSKDSEKEAMLGDVISERQFKPKDRSSAISDKPTKTVPVRPDISGRSQKMKQAETPEAKIVTTRKANDMKFPQARDSTNF